MFVIPGFGHFKETYSNKTLIFPVKEVSKFITIDILIC